MSTLGRTAKSSLNDAENRIDLKKVESKYQGPSRRPALRDVGNKAAPKPDVGLKHKPSKVTIKTKLQTLTEHKTAKVTETKTTNPTENKITNAPETKTANSTENKSANETETKPTETTLQISSPKSYTERQLNIYNPDKSTSKDPNAVTEYVNDIFENLRSLERKYPIEKDYLNDDHKTRPFMRKVLINWLIIVQSSFKLTADTLFLGIGIVDRYLQKRPEIGPQKLQLVGITGMFIAMKYEEVYFSTIDELLYICEEAFTRAELLNMEIDILKELDFHLSYPTDIAFLRRYSKIGKVTSEEYTLAKFLVESALLEHTLSHIFPSIRAAAACCLSVAILREELDFTKIWTPTLIHYGKYELKDFERVITDLALMISRQEKSKHQEVRKKYASSSLYNVSENSKLKGNVVEKLTEIQ